MTEPSSKPAQPLLIVIGGARDGDVLVLEAEGQRKRVGSGAECQLQVEGANVEARHAEVAWEGSGVVLRDLGTASGTYLNGEKTTAPQALANGDRICLGPPGSRASVKLLARIPDALSADALALESEPLILAAPEPTGLAPVVEPEDEEEPILLDPVPETAPPPLPPATVRAPVQDDFDLLGPSIVTPKPRAAPRRAAPPEKAPARRRARRKGSPLRWVAAGLLLTLGGGLAWRAFRFPTPTVTDASPLRTEPGGRLTITGTGFSAEAAGNTVFFGEVAAPVETATPTSLSLVVPAGAPLGATPVSVRTRGGRSNALAVSVRRMPRGLRLEPGAALPGAIVVVHGTGLDTKGLQVRVGGASATLLEAAATRLSLTVPTFPLEEGRRLPVTLHLGPEAPRSSLELVLGTLPLVAEVDPPRGQAGERVKLKGLGFDPDPARNVVEFAGTRALVIAATATDLTVVAPALLTRGGQVDVPVVVKAGGGLSSGRSRFNAQRPSGDVFVPRFYAGALSEDGAGTVGIFIDPGPVIALTGADGAASAAARAAKAAETLNAAFETAPSRGGLAFEVRPGEIPGVAPVGQPLLLRATVEDTAGYAQGLVPGARPARPSPQALAEYWAAMLHDLATLFVDRQRPTRLADITPRGRLLVSLYSESQRRGGGVPVSTLSPPSAELARSFREMALLVPAGRTGGGSVVGRWEGTVNEGGRERPLRLDLRLTGTRLTGTLSTRAGDVAMNVPLTELRYERNVLSFVVPHGTGPRRYRGVVEGASLTGGVTAEGGREAGRFLLRYVE